jgi:hypothetical protein
MSITLRKSGTATPPDELSQIMAALMEDNPKLVAEHAR